MANAGAAETLKLTISLLSIETDLARMDLKFTADVCDIGSSVSSVNGKSWNSSMDFFFFYRLQDVYFSFTLRTRQQYVLPTWEGRPVGRFCYSRVN